MMLLYLAKDGYFFSICKVTSFPLKHTSRRNINTILTLNKTTTPACRTIGAGVA